jgi:hypothetical protein
MIGEYLKSLASSTGSLTVKSPCPELAEGPPSRFCHLAYAGIHSCSVLLPSSPPTALGGSTFLTRIIQKQKTHGTQSMGFKTNINLNQMQCFDSVFFRVFASADFRVFPCHSVAKCLFFFFFSMANSNSPMERSPWA